MANFVLISLGALLFVYSVSAAETGKKLDDACTDDKECSDDVFGSVCKDQMCKCDTKYLTEKTMCVGMANATCTEAGKPHCLANASCTNGVCMCKENYKANAQKTKCELQNGAAAITFSLMLTVAAVLTSRFF